jgi:hypothetical protein
MGQPEHLLDMEGLAQFLEERRPAELLADLLLRTCVLMFSPRPAGGAGSAPVPPMSTTCTEGVPIRVFTGVCGEEAPARWGADCEAERPVPGR